MTDVGGQPMDDRAVLDLCARRRPRDARFRQADYLDWLYRQNPEGHAVHAEVDRDGRLLAHVAAIPQRWCSGAEEVQLGLLVNFMATGDGRRLGHLPELVRRLRAAGRERSAPGAFAITNASSTAIARRVLHGRHLGALPVVVGPSPRSARRTAELVDSGALRPDDDQLLARWVPPADRWHQQLDVAMLRWRLARPDATYALHRGADAVAISTVTTVARIRFAVICKVLRLDDGTGVRPTADLVAAACAHHQARAFVHAGIEQQLAFEGIRPPRRLLPSPLHLLYLPVGDEAGPALADLGSFSFLDFDAY